jgi:pyrophosphatase PpaX
LNKITTIIFDLDGTLIDSSEGIVEAYNYALTQYDMAPVERERIVPLIGFPVESMFQLVTDKYIPELKSAFRAKAMETVVKSSLPLKGAEETLTALFEKHYRLSIATTKIRPHIDGILEKLNWRSFFDSVVGGDEVSQVKPHPAQFQHLIGKLNCSNSSVAAVGDTINDILAARALGLTEIAVRSPYGNSIPVQQLNPHYFLEDISELKEVLEDN